MKTILKTFFFFSSFAFLFIAKSHAVINFPENNIGKNAKILENGNRASNVYDPDQGGYERIDAEGGYIRFNNTKYGNTSAVGTGYGHFPTDNDGDVSTLRYVAMRVRLSAGITNNSNLEIGLYVQTSNKNGNNHKKYGNWTSDGTTPLPSLTSNWQWVVFKTTDVGSPTPWFRVWFTNAIGVIEVSDIYVCEFQPVYLPSNNDNNVIGSDSPIHINNGNVGIGITNPAVKLDVDGIIRAHELKLCLDQGCDYVFDDNYKLMSLSEVENFIKAHKHLPDVAPATRMESEGIGVSEMSALLLRKIEENMLYMIELKKENEQLKREIELLKK